MENCKKCGHPVTENSGFCEKCGTLIIQPQIDTYRQPQVNEIPRKKHVPALKNKKIITLAAVVLVFIGLSVFLPMMFSGNKKPSSNDKWLNGIWVKNENGAEIVYKFKNGKAELFLNKIQFFKCTYTVQDKNLRIEATHMHGSMAAVMGFNGFESKWYSMNEVRTKMRTDLTALGASNAEINEFISSLEVKESYTYNVSSKNLNLTQIKNGQINHMHFDKK
ncbi:MAG: hypothetical protein FWC22_05370 [Treponema sp.]|nr:hypothetical protein [Treponema sp.]